MFQHSMSTFSRHTMHIFRHASWQTQELGGRVAMQSESQGSSVERKDTPGCIRQSFPYVLILKVGIEPEDLR